MASIIRWPDFGGLSRHANVAYERLLGSSTHEPAIAHRRASFAVPACGSASSKSRDEHLYVHDPRPRHIPLRPGACEGNPVLPRATGGAGLFLPIKQ